MDAQFHLKSGELTEYALACGYVQLYGEFRLYRDGCYHVAHPDTGFWETFSSLTEARQTARRLSKGSN
jgi:hypothetical protein